MVKKALDLKSVLLPTSLITLGPSRCLCSMGMTITSQGFCEFSELWTICECCMLFLCPEWHSPIHMRKENSFISSHNSLDKGLFLGATTGFRDGWALLSLRVMIYIWNRKAVWSNDEVTTARAGKKRWTSVLWLLTALWPALRPCVLTAPFSLIVLPLGWYFHLSCISYHSGPSEVSVNRGQL